MCKFVPKEAVQAWQNELSSITMSQQSLERYTQNFVEAYQLNNVKYIHATIDALVDYTIASLVQIMRFTAEQDHRSAFDDLWQKYKYSYPRFRSRVEGTKRG
jgi:hypothetical protein